jgi:hypothetical protein
MPLEAAVLGDPGPDLARGVATECVDAVVALANAVARVADTLGSKAQLIAAAVDVTAVGHVN